MDQRIRDIAAKLERLKQHERDSILHGLQIHFRQELDLSEGGLSLMSEEMLATILNTVNGFIMTKEYVPDIRSAYESMKGVHLPNKVEFGRKLSEEDE